MPTTPRHEDMRLDPSLNVTPEGSLGDLLAAVGHVEEDRVRENQFPSERSQGAPSETANVDISHMHLKRSLKRIQEKHSEEFKELERQVEKKH